MLDPKALHSLQEVMGGSRDDLVELIGDFLGEAPGHLAVLGDPAVGAEALRRAAHTLKSNLRDLGAHALSDQCGRLEKELATGADVAAVALLAAAILSDWPAVERALQEEMAR